MLLTRLRRLARAPGSAFAEVQGPVDMAGFGPDAAGLTEADATVVEGGGGGLRAVPVGPPAGTEFSAFLDGIQRAAVALHHGVVPIVYAYAAAVVRTRSEGRLETLCSPRPLGLRGRGDGRAAATGGDGVVTRAAPGAGRPAHDTSARGWSGRGVPYLAEREAVVFPFRYVDPRELAMGGVSGPELLDSGPPDDEPLPLFPPLLYARAAQQVSRLRESIETELARRWCVEADVADWLMVDGSITLCPELAACGRAVGIIKSHRTRFFDGGDARVLLGLQVGERTTVFQPQTRVVTPVYSWYLRLRSPAGRDALWGLIRVDAAADPATVERADEISRWILAETSPLALPDARWDRLLYPIRDCEEYLRSRAPNL